MLRTTDPKDIAILYLVTSFGFFLAGGVMALLMRGELAAPGQQFLSNEQYNQLFTMHDTIMLLLYARAGQDDVPDADLHLEHRSDRRSSCTTHT